MKTNFSLLFYLKKQKNYISGTVPIYMRITVRGKRAEITTGRECEPAKWNAKAGKAIGTKEEVKLLNAYLDQLQTLVYQAYHSLTHAGEMITSNAIKNSFLGKVVISHTLLEAIKDHNQNMKALVGKDYAAGTLRRFEVLERHIISYLLFKYNKSDLEIKQVDHEFISGFDFYLRTQKENTTNTAVKHLKNLGKIVRICLSNQWISSDPFFGYKLKTKSVHREYLTAEELRKIEEKRCSTKRLSQVRDFFVFSCYTGLSYADVQKLKLSDISIGIDGERWIFTYRVKTDTRVAIPLLPVAATILDRYKDYPVCLNEGKALPVSSNQKMNEYCAPVKVL
jgi:hypothetical protein